MKKKVCIMLVLTT